MRLVWWFVAVCGGTGLGCKGASVPLGVGTDDASGEEAATPNPGAEQLSGERLEVRAWAHAGRIAGTDIFDTELGTLCDFSIADDGVERCLPRAQSGVLYIDRECETPVIRVWDDCPRSDTFGRELGPRVCGDPEAERTTIYRPTATEFTPEPNQFLFEMRDGECVDGGFTAEDPAPLRLAERMPPEAFVASERRVRTPAEAPVRAVLRAGSDGSVTFEAFESDDGRCARLGGRCAPEPWASVQVGRSAQYLDPGCSRLVSPVGCVAPKVLRGSDESAPCGTGRLFEPGAAMEGVTTYVVVDGECREEEGESVVHVVEEIDPSRFPTLARQDRGNAVDGVVSWGWVTDEGRLGPSIGFRSADAERAAPCDMVEFDGDGAQCVPGALAYWTLDFFADSECTKPVVPNYLCEYASYVLVGPLRSCNRVFEANGAVLHELLGAHDGRVFVRDAGGCSEFERRPTDRFQHVGDLVDPGGFARMTRVTL